MAPQLPPGTCSNTENYACGIEWESEMIISGLNSLAGLSPIGGTEECALV